MGKGRLEAFSDGVIAIIITIMVLGLEVPQVGTLAALEHMAPVLLGYVLSFVHVGIYWNKLQYGNYPLEFTRGLSQPHSKYKLLQIGKLLFILHPVGGFLYVPTLFSKDELCLTRENKKWMMAIMWKRRQIQVFLQKTTTLTKRPT